MPNLLSRSVFNLFYGARRKALGNLPGPQPGILGTAGDFLTDTPPWQVCARYGREYGGVTLIWLLGKPGLVLNDPALIEQVLDSRRTEFEKGSLREELTPTTTEHSLFIARQSEDWGAKRKADPFEQPWTEDWLDAQVGPMQAVITESVKAYAAQGTIDLTPALRRLTFDAFAVAAVGEKLPDTMYEDFLLLAKNADARIKAKLPLRFVSPPEGFEAAKARYYQHFFDRVSAARKAANPNAVDLISRMVREMPETPDQVLGLHAALMFYGGVFSSSTTLVGAFHQLQKYPAAEQRLAAEAAALGGGTWTREQLNSAAWVEAVAYESLRILPAVRLFTRLPVQDTDFAGVRLPAGSTVMISNQHLHHDPAHWKDPDTFEPARWLNGGIAKDPLGSGHFFPFGRGPRACVAGNFAMVFLRTAIATLAARAKVQVDSTEPFEEGFFFGVVLPTGVTGKFVLR